MSHELILTLAADAAIGAMAGITATLVWGLVMRGDPLIFTRSFGWGAALIGSGLAVAVDVIARTVT